MEGNEAKYVSGMYPSLSSFETKEGVSAMYWSDRRCSIYAVKEVSVPFFFSRHIMLLLHRSFRVYNIRLHFYQHLIVKNERQESRRKHFSNSPH